MSELHAVCDLSHIVHNKCVHAVSVCQICFLIKEWDGGGRH